jgi:hypothetical protein
LYNNLIIVFSTNLVTRQPVWPAQRRLIVKAWGRNRGADPPLPAGAPSRLIPRVSPTPSGAPLPPAEAIWGESFATGSAACVSAGQNRPDDPQDREDEANEAKDPMALAEAENREDDEQNQVDDA